MQLYLQRQKNRRKNTFEDDASPLMKLSGPTARRHYKLLTTKKEPSKMEIG